MKTWIAKMILDGLITELIIKKKRETNVPLLRKEVIASNMQLCSAQFKREEEAKRW